MENAGNNVNYPVPDVLKTRLMSVPLATALILWSMERAYPQLTAIKLAIALTAVEHSAFSCVLTTAIFAKIWQMFPIAFNAAKLTPRYALYAKMVFT